MSVLMLLLGVLIGGGGTMYHCRQVETAYHRGVKAGKAATAPRPPLDVPGYRAVNGYEAIEQTDEKVIDLNHKRKEQKPFCTPGEVYMAAKASGQRRVGRLQ